MGNQVPKESVMFRRLMLCAAVVVGLAMVGGGSEAQAGNCYRGGGFYGGYGGGYHRTARYHGHPGFYRGPVYRGPVYGAPVYRRSFYAGHPAYYGGYRSGVTLSFGW